jgi:hypothetical protein
VEEAVADQFFAPLNDAGGARGPADGESSGFFPSTGDTMAGTLNAVSAAKAVAAAGQLLESAKSGGFRISERGAEPLLVALRRMQERLDAMQPVLHILEQEPRLGSSPYALTVAAHDRKSAIGEQGIVPVLTQFRQMLRVSIEALERAAGLYREAEEDSKSVWNRWEK